MWVLYTLLATAIELGNFHVTISGIYLGIFIPIGPGTGCIVLYMLLATAVVHRPTVPVYPCLVPLVVGGPEDFDVCAYTVSAKHVRRRSHSWSWRWLMTWHRRLHQCGSIVGLGWPPVGVCLCQRHSSHTRVRWVSDMPRPGIRLSAYF